MVKNYREYDIMCPIYEFECDKCKYSEDMIIPMSDRNSPLDCPKCGAVQAFNRTQASNAVFDLKGKGFFRGGLNGKKP